MIPVRACIAVCCGVLQCVAVCCSVLQYIVMCDWKVVLMQLQMSAL